MILKWLKDRVDMVLKEETVFRKRSRGPAEQLRDAGETFETGNSRRSRFEGTSSVQQ